MEFKQKDVLIVLAKCALRRVLLCHSCALHGPCLTERQKHLIPYPILAGKSRALRTPLTLLLVLMFEASQFARICRTCLLRDRMYLCE